MKKEKKLNKSKYLPKVIEGLGMFGRKEKQGSGEKNTLVKYIFFRLVLLKPLQNVGES